MSHEYDDSVLEIGRRRFDPWRSAASLAMRALVAEVETQVLNAEHRMRPRERARKVRDAENFSRTVEALVCDLAHRCLTDGLPISVPRSKRILARRSRYRAPFLGEQLPGILDLLATPELAFAVQDLGSYSPRGNTPTLLRAGPRLVSRIRARGITLADIGRREGAELVLLSTKDDNGTRHLVEYKDNALTERYRSEVRRINAGLAAADIAYVGPELVDTSARHLARRFTRSSFESGGRLWGGWWLNLPRNLRLAHTRINGEPVVSLDFGGMVVRTCYAKVGAVPPTGDAYALDLPELPRETIKRATAACLYASNRLTAWPRELAPFAGAVKWSRFLDALRARHPALVPVLFRGIGHAAQHIESTILVDVLLRLQAQNITALPVHDALVVPVSAQRVTEAAMRASFTEHTKLPAVITVEHSAPLSAAA